MLLEILLLNSFREIGAYRYIGKNIRSPRIKYRVKDKNVISRGICGLGENASPEWHGFMHLLQVFTNGWPSNRAHVFVNKYQNTTSKNAY